MFLPAGDCGDESRPPMAADSASETALADEARSGDLAGITGLAVPVVSTSRPRGGAIFVSVQGAGSQELPEGGQSHVS